MSKHKTDEERTALQAEKDYEDYTDYVTDQCQALEKTLLSYLDSVNTDLPNARLVVEAMGALMLLSTKLSKDLNKARRQRRLNGTTTAKNIW
tara:strand:+ start:57 stop:332 length:276 start_codon:yes stop_codon:yes gene_type:complete